MQDNQIQSRNMAEAVDRYEDWSESKSQKWFWEGSLQADEQFSV